MKQVRDGYKMTELGEIPDEWEVSPLKRVISDFLVPMRDKPKSFDGSIPWCRIEDIEGKYLNDSLSNQRVTMETIEQMRMKIIPKWSVICSCSARLGVCAITTQELTTNQTFIALVPNKFIDTEYLYYTLSSHASRLQAMSAGTTIPYLSRKQFEEFNILVPELMEQQKIAEILSTVDEQIENTEQLIEKTKELKKGLMQQLLTKGIGHTEFKQTELGEIPVEWDIEKLENLTTKIGDGIHTTPNYDPNGSYAFVNGNNIKKFRLVISGNTKLINEMEFMKYKQSLDENTILLSINGTIGNLGIYNNENVLLGKSIAFINVSEKIDKEFLFYFLSSEIVQMYFIKELTGTTIKNLSLKTIRETKVYLPILEEQQKIASILSSVDEQIENYEQEKQEYLELKKGLMQQLLTGQIRVTV